MKWRLPIGTVLLLMNLTTLVLPISGIWTLRLYESALVRQTESELIAQSALIGAAYQSAWQAAGGTVDPAMPRVDPRWSHLAGFGGPWIPRFPGLDLAADPVLPAPPDPIDAAWPADPAASQAGKTLTPILRDAQRMTLAAMRILDRNGVVTASTGEAVGYSLIEQEEVRRALLGEPISVIRARGKGAAPGYLPALDRGSTIRVFTAMPVIEDDRVIGVILVSRTPESIAEALYGKRWHLFALTVLLLAAAAVFALLGRFAISRPLGAVMDQAKRTAGGERGALVRMKHLMVSEVDELSQAITRMAASLEQRADYIRDFATHVSHEFKTPLTTIRGTVELLREHLDEMSQQDRHRFLYNLDAESERLARLVTRLLDLARADMMFRNDSEKTDLSILFHYLADHYRSLTREINVNCEGQISVAIEQDAMDTVLRNLLDNAYQHGGLDQPVTIHAERNGDIAKITVADTGPGIDPANNAQIFDPFFTSARDRGGSGLGLSIARSLLNAYGGKIKLIPSENGAIFEIQLPVSAGQK